MEDMTLRVKQHKDTNVTFKCKRKDSLFHHDQGGFLFTDQRGHDITRTENVSSTWSFIKQPYIIVIVRMLVFGF